MITETSTQNIRFTIGELRLAVGKLTAGRRVQPTLIKIFADMIGDDSQRLALALMLEAVIGWSRRMRGAWWYKTRQDWYEECGIKRAALDKQMLLQRAGVQICLKPRRAGLSAVYHYRLNEAVFLARFALALETDVFQVAAVLREIQQPEPVEETPEPMRRAWQEHEHEWPKWEPNLDGRRNEQLEVSKSALRSVESGTTESSVLKALPSGEESDNNTRAGAREEADALGSGKDVEPVVVGKPACEEPDLKLWGMIAGQIKLQAGLLAWMTDQMRLEKRDGAAFVVTVEDRLARAALEKHQKLLDRLASDAAGEGSTVRMGLRPASVPAFVGLAVDSAGLYESDAAAEIAEMVSMAREPIAALVEAYGAAEVKRAARSLQIRAPGLVKDKLAYLQGTLANFERAG